MAMVSPFFVKKGKVYLYNLSNSTIRPLVHGNYVLVHAYTPSTGDSTVFPPSNLRELKISPTFVQDGAAGHHSISFMRLGFNGRYIHDFSFYPTQGTPASNDENNAPSIIRPEDIKWEPPRQIGGGRNHGLFAGGVVRIDTEAAVVFMDSADAVPSVNQEWLLENELGLNDDFGLKALEDFIGGRGQQGVRVTGSTISFGFVLDKTRKVVTDQGGWEGKTTHFYDGEGFEFAQLELAHASMPGINDHTKGGREVLVFIKLQLSGGHGNVSSLSIEHQTLRQHIWDIIREVNQGNCGRSLVLIEKFSDIRDKDHDWEEWSEAEKRSWIYALIDAIIDGSRGFMPQRFEEARASLAVENSAEVMKCMLKRMRRDVDSMRPNIGRQEIRYRYEGLMAAIAYISDRHKGTVNYVNMINAWVDDKLLDVQVMGQRVRKPKDPEILAKKKAAQLKKEKEKMVKQEEGDLIDLSTPTLPIDEAEMRRKYGSFYIPGGEIKPSRRSRRAQRSRERKAEKLAKKNDKGDRKEEEDVNYTDLFSKVTQQPLPKGLLDEKAGAGSVNLSVKMQYSRSHNQVDSVGPIKTIKLSASAAVTAGAAMATAAATAAETSQDFELIHQLRAQRSMTRANEETERQGKREEAQQLVDMLQNQINGLDEDVVMDLGGQLDFEDMFATQREQEEEDEQLLPNLIRTIERMARDERGTLSSVSSHGTLSSYHSDDARLPSPKNDKRKGKEKEVLRDTPDTTPKAKKTKKVDGDGVDVDEAMEEQLGITPIKKSHQGLWAKLNAEKEAGVAKFAERIRKGFEKREEKNDVVDGEEKMGVVGIGGGKTLTPPSA